jgi:hypothetical protein
MIIHHDRQGTVTDLTCDEGANFPGMDLGSEASPAEEIANGLGAFGQFLRPRTHRWNVDEAPEILSCPN